MDLRFAFILWAAESPMNGVVPFRLMQQRRSFAIHHSIGREENPFGRDGFSRLAGLLSTRRISALAFSCSGVGRADSSSV